MLRMLVEQPMIRLGRRLTSRDRSGRLSPELEPAVDRPARPAAAIAETDALVFPAEAGPMAAGVKSPGDAAAEAGARAEPNQALPAHRQGPMHSPPSVSST
jgi:hypothetical protein